MGKKLIVGSRDSALAIAQSEIVIDLIKRYCPQYDIELVALKTTGDKILDKTLDKIGGKGLFVKELDKALIEKKVDITVHSLKDVPMQLDKRLPLIAYIKREQPFDVLVLPKGRTDIDFTKPIGSSSKRREIQFKKMYPKAVIKPVRGNVITRLKKLDSGEYGALILAQAGLVRLGLEERISKIFKPEEILPAAGQGIITVQARTDSDYDFVKYINDKNSEMCALAERAFVTELDGGCSSPIAAYADLTDDNLKLTGLYADDTTVKIGTVSGMVYNGVELGKGLARQIRSEL